MENQNKNSSEKISPNNANLDKRLKSFQDIEGLSTKKLNFGLWYVEHLKQLRLALIIFLVGLAVVSWFWTIYGFAYYLISGMKQDDILIDEIAQTSGADHSYISQSAPQGLNFSPVQVLNSTDKKYDLVAQIENINLKSWAQFDYYFSFGSQATKKSSGFILPGETKYLLALAEPTATRPANVQLIIENLRWQRVNQHQISDWQDYYESHLAIVNTDIKFTPASQSDLSQKLGLNQLSFNSFNRTPFNYWQVDFIILLYSGNALVSVDKYGLTDFMSGENRPVQLSWPGNIGRIDKIEIIPEINIMDDNIYIKYEGGIGEER